MPLCWIFLLKRRSELQKVSFSLTRTSANPGSPPWRVRRVPAHGLRPGREHGRRRAAAVYQRPVAVLGAASRPGGSAVEAGRKCRGGRRQVATDELTASALRNRTKGRIRGAFTRSAPGCCGG